MNENLLKPAAFGILGLLGLLGFYFAVVSLVSGFDFALSQFAAFWYYIVSLSAGFGVQIGLYSYLRSAVIGRNSSGKIAVASGATSAVAMISCCAHYLANILPLLGAAGAVTILTQYQIQFFWLGLAFNIGGIAYISNKIIKFKKHEME